jgi:epoxyqueuosine reductase
MLKEKIKQLARDAKFDLVGFTKARPPAHLDIFTSWLEKQYHAGMKYLSSDRSILLRSDPRNILPGANSIIVLGARYHSSMEISNGAFDAFTGRIASFAWDVDYHQVLPEKIGQLIQQIMRSTGSSFTYKVYTDSGPVLERDFAHSAGLGWVGKNSCLISPQKGSFLFLAEIITDLELEPDVPFREDFCGTCLRCVQACPTQCILPDRTIDASRCISYLTIENKGMIPRSLREKTGRWVFGCDVCQSVCPWNHKANRDAYDSFFHVRKEIAFPNLVDEMQLTPQVFKEKFTASPILRAKYRGYLRNVACALGNTHNPAAVPVLRNALHTNPEILIRQHAAWALGQIPSRQSRNILEAQLQHENDSAVRSEINLAIEQLS